MKFTHTTFAIAASLAALAVAPAARAQQITDPNQITLRHDFETDPINVPPPGPFVLGSTTFSESSTGTGGPGWRLLSGFFNGTRTLTDNAGISDITVTFGSTMLKAGMLVGIGRGTYSVDFLNGQNVVGNVTQTVVGTTDSFFAGWQNAGGITSMHITEPSGENGLVGGLDDVRFDVVPEPVTLISLGAAGLALLRRRRKA